MGHEKDVFYTADESRQYTHLNFKNDPNEFQFAVITDNAGGARPGVFPKAVEMVNWLHPEFVVHAGDLIEGYSDDEEQIKTWWKEVDGFLEQLEMPFFFLPGNHDFYSDAAIKEWYNRFGNDRGYFHFIYKGVLFLMVNTEDPPKRVEALRRDKPDLFARVEANYMLMAELQAKGEQTEEDGRKLLELGEPIEEWLGEINISDAQVAYFKEVIEANTDVRWTFCLVHAPPFFTPAATQRDPGNFVQIEALLADRPYTVFSAHTHTYNYDLRNGRDYITTATSGAMNVVRPGAMDHVVWVTMAKDGPKIVNLLMNGIMDKTGPSPEDAMEHIGLYHPPGS